VLPVLDLPPGLSQVMMWETSVILDPTYEPDCLMHEMEPADGTSSIPSPVRAPASRHATPVRSAHITPAQAPGEGDRSRQVPTSWSRSRQESPRGVAMSHEAHVKVLPRSSAVKFTHIPISSVLTAMLDGPMVTLSAVLYALSHQTWDGTGIDALGATSDAVMFGVEGFVGEQSAYRMFQGVYWLMVFFALLSIVLFVARAHERCVYALREVETVFHTDYERKGASRVEYKTVSGLALYLFERFLVYFIIVLGGAGFFMISRYLLKVIECRDGRWEVNLHVMCYTGAHRTFLIVSGVLFPIYILIAARMSASYNDVTYLSEVEDALPPTTRKLRQLFTFWGSTVVKRAGWWTRHPVHGWKYGLQGRLCLLLNWLTDLLVQQQEGDATTQWRWISVALWLVSAMLLVRFSFKYQPMAEPVSCKVLVVFRGLFAVAYIELALINVITMLLVAARRVESRERFLEDSRSTSIAIWAIVSLGAVPLCWRAASRVEWQAGSKTAQELASVIGGRKTIARKASWLPRRGSGIGGGAAAGSSSRFSTEDAGSLAGSSETFGDRLARRVRISLQISTPQIAPHAVKVAGADASRDPTIE
jgi:hypothetical protein